MPRLLVPDGRAHRVVAPEEIRWVEARGNYALLRVTGRNLMLRRTMADLEAELAPAAFVRVHRRVLVNLTHLTRVERGASGRRTAVLRGGVQIPVSRVGWRRLQAALLR